MSNRSFVLSIVFLAFLFSALNTMAQGLIIDNPPDKVRWGVSLPIRSHEAQVTIKEQVAVTEIEQVFYNPHKRPMEGTYLFPVPMGANLSKFTLEIDGEQVKAELLDRDKAESIYQSIVSKLKDPGLLSYAGRGLVRARIFPIEPEKTKKIQIRYEEVLSYEQGVCRYHYGLNTSKICKQPIDFVKITVDLSNDRPIRNLYSPSHDIDIDRKNDRQAKIKYSDENVVPDQDFQLIYSVSEDPIGMNLLTYKNEDENGFYLLLAAPSIEREEQPQAKDVIFILDTSGSMKQDNKIEQARQAMDFCVRSLNRSDRFALITFSDEVETVTDDLTDAGQDQVESICQKIKKISASGGTNIDEALKTAFKLTEDGNRPTYVLFLTDGLPTVGVREPKDILEHAKKWNESKCRCFTFGVGFDVNAPLLDELSQKNKGLSTYVKPNEDIEVKVSSMYAKIADPVLSDLELDFGDISVSKQYPKDLPDLFSGSQLVVMGRYEKGGSEKITLTGKANGQRKTISEEFVFTKDDTERDYIPRLWAARRIAYLMNEIRQNGRNKELVEEIVDLSQTYGILTEYTSFLVKEAPIATRPMPQVEQEQIRLRSLGYVSKSLDRKMSEQAGRGAVANSELLQDQLSNAPLSAQNSAFSYDVSNERREKRIEGVRYTGNQAFFNQHDAWVSTQFDANQTVLQVKPYSKAYFQLANLSSDVAQILALGENISFVRNNVMVQIADNGVEELDDSQLNSLE